MIKIFIAIFLIAISSISCCHFDKDNKTMWGMGKYKDKDVEMECNSPIENIFNLSGINTD